jgi:DNA adenine methylase
MQTQKDKKIKNVIVEDSKIIIVKKNKSNKSVDTTLNTTFNTKNKEQEVKVNKSRKLKFEDNITNVKINEEKIQIKLNEEKIKKTNKNLLIKDKYSLDKFNFQKPFLKWVGGKTQIINDIIGNFPVSMENYHEIFLGGGSVLFALLTLQKEEKIKINNKVYAYDFNEPLIYVYKNIQNKPKKFIETIKNIIEEYNNIDGDIINRKPKNKNEALSSQESYFYWIRKQYNELNSDDKLSIIGSAYFLFLNKTCFRGVFRLGKIKKDFNVPFGHYSNPSIIDEDSIKQISELIKDVEFIHASFEESLKNISSDSFIFLDPPYVKLDKNSFVDYTADGFNKETHDKLFKILHELKKQDVKWMMSNSSAEYVIKCFDDKKKYSTDKILCRRAINSKNPESKVNEVIIKSY